MLGTVSSQSALSSRGAISVPSRLSLAEIAASETKSFLPDTPTMMIPPQHSGHPHYTSSSDSSRLISSEASMAISNLFDDLSTEPVSWTLEPFIDIESKDSPLVGSSCDRLYLSEELFATDSEGVCQDSSDHYGAASLSTVSPLSPLSQFSSSSPYQDVPGNLPAMLHQSRDSLAAHLRTPSSYSVEDMDFSSRSSSSTASSSELASPEPYHNDSDMFTVLSQWDLSSLSSSYSSAATAKETASPQSSSKKRRASEDVLRATHSRRKMTKSFRRFSSLSKEANMEGDVDGDTKKVSSMAFTISQRIAIKPRDQDEDIIYPEDSELLQRAMQATGPEASLSNEVSVEVNDSVLQRYKEGEVDIYTPRWSRGSHREREGWCHLCEEGGWYSMKRSQYLYHLQYDHGVSSQTKKVYDPPKAMRVWKDAVQSTEGLCATCNSWIPICFGPVRKRNFKVYFKHVHACQRLNSAQL